MLIRNIKQLLQTRELRNPLKGKEMQNLPLIENAWLQIKGDKISGFGEMDSCPLPLKKEDIVDASGQTLLPTWVDSHTHLLFAAPREEEFVLRLKGKSYEEIAQAGGGILNSAKKLQATSEENLYADLKKRLNAVILMGTGAIEIKSGYGLSLEAELKMLRLIKRLKAESPIPIKATFLGAHAFPAEYQNNHRGYLELIINDMLPIIAKEGLADYIDAFCEKVAFSVEETEQIIAAGAKYGLKAKIHTNQFNSMGGIELSVNNKAVSVDHLEVINENEINCLKDSNTMATLLPTAPFFLNDAYQPARHIIDAGIATAIASDYNPGSTPSGNMNFVLSLACIKLKMTPEEAINAATANAAFALEMQDEVGSIALGKKANFILTEQIPSFGFLPYSFGENHIDKVFINGKIFNHAD